MCECPKCNRSFQKAGLHGHLRFSHGLRGEELQEAYQQALEEPSGQPSEQHPEQPSGQRPEQLNEQPPEQQGSGEGEEGETKGDSRTLPVPRMPDSSTGQGSAERSEESHGRQRRQKERQRGRESRGVVERQSRRDPLREAAERLRRARERRRTIEEEMETSGLLEKKPANDTWAELLEESQEEEKEAQKALRREVRMHEAAR